MPKSNEQRLYDIENALSSLPNAGPAQWWKMERFAQVFGYDEKEFRGIALPQMDDFPQAAEEKGGYSGPPQYYAAHGLLAMNKLVVQLMRQESVNADAKIVHPDTDNWSAHDEAREAEWRRENGIEEFDPNSHIVEPADPHHPLPNLVTGETEEEIIGQLKEVGDSMIPWKCRIAAIAVAMEEVADEAQACGADWIYQVTGCVISDDFIAACDGFPDYITDDRYPAAQCLRAILRHLLNIAAHGSEGWKWVDGVWEKAPRPQSRPEEFFVSDITGVSAAEAADIYQRGGRIEMLRPGEPIATLDRMEELRRVLLLFSDTEIAEYGISIKREAGSSLWIRDALVTALERAGRAKPAAKLAEWPGEGASVPITICASVLVELDRLIQPRASE